MQVEVSYLGEHNFDWDQSITKLAGKGLYAQKMDFKTMTRVMLFNFKTEEEAKLFADAVGKAFPQFNVVTSGRASAG